MGTNISDGEVRPQIDGVRNINIDADTQTSCPLTDVMLPTSVNEQRSIHHIIQFIYDSESLRGSHTRTHDTRIQETIPQLDGPVFVRSRSGRRMSENARIEQESFQRTTASCRREYPGESSDNTHNDRRTYKDQGPPERGRYYGQRGRPPDRRRYQDGGYSRRGYPNQDGRLPGRGRPCDRNRGTLLMEDTQMMEDPLMMGDTWEMDGILDTLEDKDHQDQ